MDRKLDELLFALMQNRTIAMSGEKLARDLEVSHSTLVRWVEKLRAAGVEIRGELFTGFRLTRLPDVILPQLVRPRLRTRRLGKSFFHFYSVDSTNAFAARLLSHDRRVADGTVIISETQTAGRGRRGRTWHSEPEMGLYASLVLKPEIPAGLAPLLTLACASALHNAVERESRLDVDIKWPNDLLLGKRKIAGILAEIRAEVDRIHSLVIGAGLNVNHEAFPPEFAAKAASLRMESGRMHSRTEILIYFLEEFEELLERLQKDGPAAVVTAWTRHSSFAAGRHLKIDDGFRIVEGKTAGLNAFGALRLEIASGAVEEVYSGDVIEWH